MAWRRLDGVFQCREFDDSVYGTYEIFVVLHASQSPACRG